MKRELNYDVLRIIATLLIVAIHSGGATEPCDFPFDRFYYLASRVAVPLFVMLSGAFLLNDERTCCYGDFYHRSLLKLGLPFAGFSLFYVAFTWFIYTFNSNAFEGGPPSLWKPVFGLFMGGSYYHLWFMYMLAGLYLVSPMLARVKHDSRGRSFFAASCVACVLGCWIDLQQPNSFWLLRWVQYVGLFMMGASLRSMLRSKYNYVKGAVLMIASLTALVVWYMLLGEDTDEPMVRWLQGYLSPFLDIIAIGIFCAFSLIYVSPSAWSKRVYPLIVFISASCYFVYLLHPFYCAIEARLLRISGLKFPEIYFRPINAILIFVMCVATYGFMKWVMPRAEHCWRKKSR